jgi:hypothetical protein
MNAPALGRDVAPLGRSLGATGFARGAPHENNCLIRVPDPLTPSFLSMEEICRLMRRKVALRRTIEV